ncbi:MAG: wax ester/triacylglycerol synthase family O-acyltransferase [Nitrospirae bacterium]|nr:wax ester/triacylglycerol synthase family O-acyltransferase [Nitrospirota bacterium]
MSPVQVATEKMRRVDHAWLRMDEPANLMMINGLLFFDQPLDLGEVRQVLLERLLTIPRFRQRVAPSEKGQGYSWQPDPNFDIDSHLVEERLPSPGDDAVLQDLVSRWMSSPLDRSRPLWMCHLVHDYKGGSAILWRLHHCMGDGVVLMLVLLSITELESPEESRAEAAEESVNPLRALFGAEPPSREEARRYLEQVMPAAVRLLTGPAEKLAAVSKWVKSGVFVPTFGRMAVRPPDPRTVFKGRLGVPKRAAWTEPISLDDVQRIRQAIGGTMNDVLTNAVAGGLRRYLARQGPVKPKLSFRAIVPVSLRPLEEMAQLGNQFGLVFLSLPVGIEDPRERLAELQRRMGRLKRSFEPVVVLQVLGALGASPKTIQQLVLRIFGTKGTAVLTNVPGPRETLYFSGRPIRGFVFWVPQSGRLGMGIAIASYAGQVQVGIATDEGLVSDPEAIVAGFHEEFSAMLELAERQ